MTAPRSTERGSLTVVGTGIKLGAHVTVESLAAIKGADLVLHVVTDAHTAKWLRSLNPSSESLLPLYGEGKPRASTYSAMTDRIVSEVLAGRRVCAVFYGHPGIFVQSSHDAVAAVREHGLSARMLPGVSAEDCLFADLGFDPAVDGLQTYEASMFLERRPRFDTSVALFLWQIGVIDVTDRGSAMPGRAGLERLVTFLSAEYSADHTVTVYEASIYAVCDPAVQPMPVSDLATAQFSPIASLLVPPLPTSVAEI